MYRRTQLDDIVSKYRDQFARAGEEAQRQQDAIRSELLAKEEALATLQREVGALLSYLFLSLLSLSLLFFLHLSCLFLPFLSIFLSHGSPFFPTSIWQCVFLSFSSILFSA